LCCHFALCPTLLDDEVNINKQTSEEPNITLYKTNDYVARITSLLAGATIVD
jgi:hypothetical protein